MKRSIIDHMVVLNYCDKVKMTTTLAIRSIRLNLPKRWRLIARCGCAELSLRDTNKYLQDVSRD